MANVIGIDPKHQKECSCRYCASVVAYAQAEIQTALHRSFNYSVTRQDYIICPKCGEHINLFTRQ